MRSDTIKKGFERAPHRSLLRATGVIQSESDFNKPFIGIANSYIDLIPGHVHLQKYGKIAKKSIRETGGVPFEFNTIGVDDGIAMGHIGMRYSLASRELIADSIEIVAEAHRLDGLVCITNCDKIVPGMLMAAVRLNIPTIFISGGPMKAGTNSQGETVDLISIFEGVGRMKAGELDEALLLNNDGTIAEGAGQNIFLIKNKEIYTNAEDSSILMGITRESVIHILTELGFNIHISELSLGQLYTADEAFFTGTASEVTPIRAVDGRIIGNGRRGSLTELIQKTYFDAIKGKEPKYNAWLTYIN
ncbi:MAG: hypothetical protein HN657_08075 [Candidatus Marinimicrobia bacterium]|jgi:hypothetical protein|nr:hypothetical protein [Candidatus Neomarinimicrobiota bacterium]MBT3496555.1 hypothetical protein [Candidatus Neomarinimicrobiota bacterium]MBT3692340.1 hypothetical protein [Candidatus Neomarinimicrobiota bacterium]MBT3731486.1 hypothetical protein [Candidatus Neomarinimicrobiota bacterium]MBT4144901.1 hypothetical protein [Candidatus Neomarinimicrobiota bacterium]